MKDKKRTPKQEMFCKEYVVDFNGTQAVIRAGYSKNGADVQAIRLLGNVRIQERIQELIKERSEKVEITAERVLKEIAILAFSNIPDYFKQIGSGSVYTLTMEQFENMPENASRAISSVEQNVNKDGDITYKIRLWDKSRNLENLCKHLGITSENIKVSIDANIEKEKAKHIVEELKEQGLLK